MDNSRRNDLVETEPDEGPKPSPKQKTELVHKQKRDEQRPENTCDSRRDGAVGDDRRNSG